MGSTTNIILDFLRGKKPEQIIEALDNLEQVAKSRQTALSDMVELVALLDFTKTTGVA